MIASSSQPLITNNLIFGPLALPLYVSTILLCILHKVTNWVHPYLHMVYDVLFILYTGSFLSLKFFTLVCKPPTTSTSNSWIKYPLYALLLLLAIFFGMKYLGKTIINFVLTIYFSYLAVYAIKHWLDDIISYSNFMGLVSYKFFEISFIKRLSYYDFICYAISIILVLFYALTKHWILNNICAFAFCLYALRNINIKKLSFAFIMLALFLIYDLFFVFGTEIMETLAVNIEGPIRLLYLKKDGQFALIGLGDVLLPGIVISFCLRIDVFIYFKQRLIDNKETLKSAFPVNARMFSKVYFTGSLIGYLCGFVIAIVITHTFSKAQPALLYLVPSVIFAVLITALIKGEFRTILCFDEENTAKNLAGESKKNKNIKRLTNGI